jgi:hypothetical protein
LNDTFIISEVIGSNSTEAILESEISISNDMPNIEKIISTEGKIKINRADISNNKINLSGDLIYNIIYRSNDEETSVYSMSGKIPFNEEIQADGAKENMEPRFSAYLDYIESELLSEREFKINAVADLDVDIINKHSVDFISTLESNGTLQAKSKNIAYTDVVFESSEELSINDAVEISKSADEIANILKKDADVYITNIDVMNDRMLVEGICKVGFLFSENNTIASTGYVTEEFPFTHYIELKDSSEDMVREIDVVPNDLTCNVEGNYDNEQKIISFKAAFNINSKIYGTVEKNIITDCYSTDSKLDIDSSILNLVSTKKVKENTIKYENTFDIGSGSIKDIYSTDVSPKISDKNIVDNEYVIEGFLDVNLLYLNGDVNKIDRAYSSMPFTAAIELNEADLNCDISSDIKISKCNAYRKNNNSVNAGCEIKVTARVKESDEVCVINSITEAGPIDHNKMPSLIFRVVQQGETIWDIAKNYNVSINYLKELNDLSSENLVPGSKVIIARKV